MTGIQLRNPFEKQKDGITEYLSKVLLISSTTFYNSSSLVQAPFSTSSIDNIPVHGQGLDEVRDKTATQLLSGGQDGQDFSRVLSITESLEDDGIDWEVTA